MERPLPPWQPAIGASPRPAQRSSCSAGWACSTPPRSGSAPCSAPASSWSSPRPPPWPGPAGRRGGPGRRRGLLQRRGLGAAGRQVSRQRRHLRLRPEAAGRVAGLHRRLGFRDRQDGVLRGHGADLRPLCGAGLRHAGGGGRRRGPDRRQPARHHPDRAADPDPAVPWCWPRWSLWRRPRAGRPHPAGAAAGDGGTPPAALQAGWGRAAGRRPDVLRLRRLRPDRHAGRRGQGSRPDHSAGHPRGAGRRLRDLPGPGAAAAVAISGGAAGRPSTARCSTPSPARGCAAGAPLVQAGRRRLPRRPAGADHRAWAGPPWPWPGNATCRPRWPGWAARTRAVRRGTGRRPPS